jgi:hypothetical protein
MARKVKSRFPPGWDEERVRRVLEHYENQSEEEAVAEDEVAEPDQPSGSAGSSPGSPSPSSAPIRP